ncbi:MAG: methyltransferase domain-containing protein, partial [Burkholderiales bacterium]
VLVVGCGLGEDIASLLARVGPEGEVHAQDISGSMVRHVLGAIEADNLCLSVSNATALPYCSRSFDVVFHFGGINLFGDMRKSIAELDRVCKLGGQVVFGDEGIASHLRGTEYADILINNNALWGLEAPLAMLPHHCTDIALEYILGNCFYIISFRPGAGFPEVDLDVPHVGLRGGTARTRYFGKLEGVTADAKARLASSAQARGVSAHQLLQEIIDTHLPPLASTAPIEGSDESPP